jgi:hypothetical protein
LAGIKKISVQEAAQFCKVPKSSLQAIVTGTTKSGNEGKLK